MSFPKFLKTVDPYLYREYQYDKLKGTKDEEKIGEGTEYVTKTFSSNVKIKLSRISDLTNIHPAKRFLVNRKIPKDFFTSLYYTEDYFAFIDEILPNNNKDLPSDKRIVIPLYNKNNELQGVQGRALRKSSNKYITILLNEASSKIYGLERLDPAKTVYVVEGPFDSMFIENAIAATDAQLYNIPIKLESMGYEKLDYVFVYDNEPRNKDIVKHMRKTIDLGYKIFIWPSDMTEYKDVNEAILNGVSLAEMYHTIQNRIFRDLNAKIEFAQWSA